MFMRMVELNSWCVIKEIDKCFLTSIEGAMLPTTSSLRVRAITGPSHFNQTHRNAGCYIHMGNHKKAQELLDACPALTEKRKLGATSKQLPTEVFILRKRESLSPDISGAAQQLWNAPAVVEFYKEKQRRRTGSEENYAESIRINTAEGELRVLSHIYPINSDVANPQRLRSVCCSS